MRACVCTHAANAHSPISFGSMAGSIAVIDIPVASPCASDRIVVPRDFAAVALSAACVSTDRWIDMNVDFAARHRHFCRCRRIRDRASRSHAHAGLSGHVTPETARAPRWIRSCSFARNSARERAAAFSSRKAGSE
jgi:hypothetical protein